MAIRLTASRPPPARSLARKALRGRRWSPPPRLLAGCNMVVMDPAGDVAVQQRNLIIASTALMLLVIVPVIALTFLFAWRYRASNTEATYDPDWHHSTQLEVVIWTVPLLIIIALGAMTWISTHTLDPFRPLARLAPNKPVPAGREAPEVEVVALDWKWLFIYPELGVASLNEMAAPANVPISFKITSSSVLEHVLRSRPRGHDLRHAGHADAAPCRDEQGGGVLGPVGALQRFRLLAHEVRLPGASASRASTSGWPRPRRAGPASTGKPTSKLEKPSEAVPVQLLRLRGERPLRRHRRHVRRAGPDVHRRDAPHRHDAAAPARTARRTASGSITTTAGLERRRSPRRHLPGLGPPAPGLGPAGRHDAPRSGLSRGGVNERSRARSGAGQRPAGGRQGARAGPVEQPADRTPPALIRASIRMFSNLDLQQLVFGRLTLEADPLPRAHPGRDLRRRGARRRRRCSAPSPGIGKWGYLWREWFTSVDHKKIGIMYVMLAIVMLLRGFADAIMMVTQKALSVGDVGGLPAAAPLRPGLHRARHDHDLLHGDAVRHRRHELHHAAADRRARRRLPVPEQFQLLDDGGRRGPHHAVPLRRRVRRAPAGSPIRRCRGRPTARASAWTTTSGGFRSRASAPRCPAST